MLAKILADAIARHHDDPALIVDDRICTYADLSRLSHAQAGSLFQRGIRAGDRIAFLLPNGPEIVLCYYACFILGAIAVPLNIRFPPEMIGYVLDHSEARVLISEPQLFAGIAPIRPERRRLETIHMVGGSTVAGVGDFGDLLRAAGAPQTDRRSGPDEPAALFYTSGTTGTPKGVIHTHGSLMGAVDNQVAEIGITEKDKTLIVLPICYLVAFGSQVLPFHASGATSVVLPGFEPRETLAAIHTHRPTKLFGFPKVYHELAEAAEARVDDLGCLDFCFSAGEAMAVTLQQRFRAAFGIEVRHDRAAHLQHESAARREEGRLNRPADRGHGDAPRRRAGTTSRGAGRDRRDHRARHQHDRTLTSRGRRSKTAGSIPATWRAATMTVITGSSAASRR